MAAGSFLSPTPTHQSRAVPGLPFESRRILCCPVEYTDDRHTNAHRVRLGLGDPAHCHAELRPDRIRIERWLSTCAKRCRQSSTLDCGDLTDSGGHSAAECPAAAPRRHERGDRRERSRAQSAYLDSESSAFSGGEDAKGVDSTWILAMIALPLLNWH